MVIRDYLFVWLKIGKNNFDFSDIKIEDGSMFDGIVICNVGV